MIQHIFVVFEFLLNSSVVPCTHTDIRPGFFGMEYAKKKKKKTFTAEKFEMCTLTFGRIVCEKCTRNKLSPSISTSFSTVLTVVERKCISVCAMSDSCLTKCHNWGNSNEKKIQKKFNEIKPVLFSFSLQNFK